MSQVVYDLQGLLRELASRFTVRAVEYENRGVCYPPTSRQTIEHRLWAIAARR